MSEFFILEGAYLAIGAFVLAITLFVTTRSFMAKGSVKKGLGSVFVVVSLAIFSHFYITKNRMSSVEEAFNQSSNILCENRIHTKAAQFVTINKHLEWSIKDNQFISPNYSRSFHLARCIIESK